MKPLIFLFALMLASSPALAKYECKHEGLVRTISVVYEGEGNVPCHVVYDKPNEGMTQIPWNAQNEEGYCEARAAEFSQKLESWGWACTEQSAPAAEM